MSALLSQVSTQCWMRVTWGNLYQLDPGNQVFTPPLSWRYTSTVGVIFEDAALRGGGVKTIWTGCNYVCRILTGSAEVNSYLQQPRASLIHQFLGLSDLPPASLARLPLWSVTPPALQGTGDWFRNQHSQVKVD